MTQNMAIRRDFEAHALPQVDDLYRTALCMLDSESEAQQVVKISIARAYYTLLKVRVRPNYRVWLFRVMANTLTNKQRSSSSLAVATNFADDGAAYPATGRPADQAPVGNSGGEPSYSITAEDITSAIGDLPDENRLIVILSLLQGFSYREIADITGITFETVRDRLHQGRRLMRRKLFVENAIDGKGDLPDAVVRNRKSG